jgi:hypothetical protein
MHPRDIPTDIPTLHILPWADPVIDQVGYDPRSRYVERFWLGILGPSATWLMRYLVDLLDHAPDGYPLDLDECATALGLGRYRGSNGAFARTIARCCQFGTSRLAGACTLEVRRRLPPLTRRQVNRLSPVLQAEHARWVDLAPAPADADDLRDQARRLALSLLELGEDGEATERQLHRWRFHPALASAATAWATEHLAARPPSSRTAHPRGQPSEPRETGTLGASGGASRTGHAGAGEPAPATPGTRAPAGPATPGTPRTPARGEPAPATAGTPAAAGPATPGTPARGEPAPVPGR